MPQDLPAGTTILLVEDNEKLRPLLSEFLSRSGATVIACGSLSDAVDRIAVLRPDLVVTDINLPDGNGFQLLARVQQLDLESGTATPILAMSASADIRMPELTAHAGFSDFLRKPFTPGRLIEAIRSALGLN